MTINPWGVIEHGSTSRWAEKEDTNLKRLSIPLKRTLRFPMLLLVASAPLNAAAADDAQTSDDRYRRVLEKAMIECDGSVEVMVREHYYPPSWKAPTHFHDGALFIYVLEGDFEVATKATGVTTYKPGEAMQMPANTVMDARNASDSKPLKLVIFQVGPPPGAPFLVPIESSS